MIFRTIRRAGLVATAVLALCAFTAVASASAATQHWAGTPQVPYGNSQAFTGSAHGSITFIWEYSGAEIEFVCTTLSTTGTVGNPAGGGAGTIESEPLAFGGCVLAAPLTATCEIKDGGIPIEGKTTTAVGPSGEDEIKYEGSLSVGLLHVVHRIGKSCILEGNYPIDGQVVAVANSGAPGIFTINSPSNLSIGGDPLSLKGSLSLSTPAKEALVLSSGASPGAAHWYLGSSGSTTLAAGGSAAFSTNSGLSFNVSTELFGAFINMSCTGATSSLSGTLGNPTGGGSGTASATLVLGGCTLAKPFESTCKVELFQSGELSGVATEVDESKVPAVEFAPNKGATIGTLKIRKKEGAHCVIEGNYGLEGRLVGTSEGDGYFNLEASSGQLVIAGEESVVSGRFALEDEAGQALRLQP